MSSLDKLPLWTSCLRALKLKDHFQKAAAPPQEAESSLFVLNHKHHVASESEKLKKNYKNAEFLHGAEALLVSTPEGAEQRGHRDGTPLLQPALNTSS